MILDINSNEVVRFTAKLERMRKSALPNAIRGTLNNAAFDVKTRTMPVQSRKEFINRSPNFFKSNSSVAMAKGWDVNGMIATVGFTDRKKVGPNDFAVRDLEPQEHSGTIFGRSFIPLNSARTSGDPNRLVKVKNRLKNILGSVVIARNLQVNPGTSKKSAFVMAVKKAGAGGYVQGSNISGENILYRVLSIDPLLPSKFKLEALYDYKKKRKIHVKETGFMRIASLNSAKRMDDFYIAQAKFQIDKINKK